MLTFNQLPQTTDRRLTLNSIETKLRSSSRIISTKICAWSKTETECGCDCFFVLSVTYTECRFDSWVQYIDAYSGGDLLYFNLTGIIPANARIKRGVKRNQPFRERKLFDITSFPTDDSSKSIEGDEIDEEMLDNKQLTELEG